MIKDEIQKLVYEALKENDKVRVGVLRYLLSQIQYKEINSGKSLADDDVVGVLRQEIKKRRESIAMFKTGNRQDLVSGNENEIKVIEEFLPPSLSDDEINKIIEDVLQKNPNPTNTGKIIGLVIASTKNRADSGKIAELVKLKLIK